MTVALDARLSTTGSPRRWSRRVRGLLAAVPLHVVIDGHGGDATAPRSAAYVLPLVGLPSASIALRPRTRPVGTAGLSSDLLAVPRLLGRIVQEILLTGLAIAGLGAVALVVYAGQTGMSPLVVRSGSMEPTIQTGAMIVVETVTAAEIEVGDVIAAERPDGTTVTHRVLSVDLQGSVAMLTMKGDANDDPDPEPVGVVEAGRLVHDLPAVGRAAAWLASASGGFVVGSLLTALLLTALRRPARQGARVRS